MVVLLALRFPRKDITCNLQIRKLRQRYRDPEIVQDSVNSCLLKKELSWKFYEGNENIYFDLTVSVHFCFKSVLFTSFVSSTLSSDFFKKLIYFILFIFGCIGSLLLHVGFLQLRQAGATLRCGAQASHLWWLLVVEHRLQACGLQQLQHSGSVAVAHGLSCSAACGIVWDQGSNLCPLCWQVDS